MLTLIITIALINATIIFTFHKWGVFSWVELHFDINVCVYCFGWWLSVLSILIAGCFINFSWYYFLIPLASSCLSYVLLKIMWI